MGLGVGWSGCGVVVLHPQCSGIVARVAPSWAGGECCLDVLELGHSWGT